MESIQFWSKTTSDGNLGLSPYKHMKNVGCVARKMAELNPGLCKSFGITPSEVGFLAASHDIGKISPGFQRKSILWLVENDLEKIERDGRWDGRTEKDHGKVTHVVLQKFLSSKGLKSKMSAKLSSVIGGHHGSFIPPNERGYKTKTMISESVSGIDWESEREECLQKLWDYFGGVQKTLFLIDSVIWWLGGLTTVADWIGSNELFFSVERDNSDDSEKLAHQALVTVGLVKQKYKLNLSFDDLFNTTNNLECQWTPNDLQKKVHSIEVCGSEVLIIEDSMGRGKTEAAFWRAYQLLVQGINTGIYFALPTQVTSNRMYSRLETYIQRISHNSNIPKLIHSNSWLMEKESPFSDFSEQVDDQKIGYDWFNSSKRALLSPFGVGTIDQSLLGAVAAKHFFVRQYALAGKIVILDEVHSYDLYTGSIIDKLIKHLKELGCTVIILSATLSKARCGELIPLKEGQESVLSYPLITSQWRGGRVKFTPVNPQKPQSCKISFINTKNAMLEAVKLAQEGSVVLYVCNTVASAQNVYQQFKEKNVDFPLGLLHSKFSFWRREQIEDEWIERLGKNGTSRCGSILVATQIVEQSLDIDADLLITELAPTDMLLQRIGRRYRHERGVRSKGTDVVYIIKESCNLNRLKCMSARDIMGVLGGKAYVYAPHILLRTLEIWSKLKTLIIPSKNRELIELTYKKREDEPKSWQQLSDDWFGMKAGEITLAEQATNLWNILLEDTEGIQTRLTKVPTISLVICQSFVENEVIFEDQTKIDFSKQPYFVNKKAIYKNIVKVPRNCFNSISQCSMFKKYLFGDQSVGIVNKNGTVDVKGLKEGVKLFYFSELGLVKKKVSKR